MITRRSIFGAVALGIASTMVLPSTGFAKEIRFSEATFKKMKASGSGFMLDFYAHWCSTCRVQSRAISGIKSRNKALSKLPVLKVDWDTYKNKKFTKDLKIPRRSTLVVFKGGREVGRVVAQTSSSSIERLMKKGI